MFLFLLSYVERSTDRKCDRSSRASSEETLSVHSSLAEDDEQVGSSSSSSSLSTPITVEAYSERLGAMQKPSSSITTTHTPPPPSYSFDHPSSITLLNRVEEAKRIGKSLHELVHELQNDFYPLNPPLGYTIPPSRFYRQAVARLEGHWNSVTQEQEQGMEQEQDSADTKRIVAAVATTTPVWLPREAATTRKSGEVPSWPSRLWNNLGISVCKRRKREREVDQDDEIEEFPGFEAGLMLKSGIRNQKRRRINTH